MFHHISVLREVSTGMISGISLNIQLSRIFKSVPKRQIAIKHRWTFQISGDNTSRLSRMSSVPGVPCIRRLEVEPPRKCPCAFVSFSESETGPQTHIRDISTPGNGTTLAAMGQGASGLAHILCAGMQPLQAIAHATRPRKVEKGAQVLLLN